jgi:hypothetical protein
LTLEVLVKGDRYTTFDQIPVGTVFRYVPDDSGVLGRRLKISAQLCCRLEWYETHGHKLAPKDLEWPWVVTPDDVLNDCDSAPWRHPRDVVAVEPGTRVRVVLADNRSVLLLVN